MRYASPLANLNTGVVDLAVEISVVAPNARLPA
jgi:hypothetical protein